MSYRIARIMVLGFLIAFPLLVRVASASSGSSRKGSVWSQAAPMTAVEIVLVGVLILADWNRHRLLAECLRRVDLARTRSVPSRRSDVHTRSSIPV